MSSAVDEKDEGTGDELYLVVAAAAETETDDVVVVDVFVDSFPPIIALSLDSDDGKCPEDLSYPDLLCKCVRLGIDT